MFVGEEETITSVTAHYNFGPAKDIPLTACTYPLIATSTKKVVEVSEGVVTAVGTGTVAVIVTYQGKTDKLLVTVKPALLDHIVVDPDEMTLFVGKTEAFRVFAHYSDGDTKNVTYNCVYGSSDGDIALVDPLGLSDDSRSVRALDFGIATISISYAEEGITKGTTLNVIVEGTITIHWLESAVRYNADDSVHSSWPDEIVPPPAPNWGPAELILTGGEYHFADVKDFYNVHLTPEMGLEGSVVIDETGLLSGQEL